MRSLFMTELDNDDKPGGLMKVNVNIVQVSVAHLTTLSTAELGKKHY